MSELELGLLIAAVTIFLLLLGIPVAFALGIVSLGFLVYYDGFFALEFVPDIFYGGLDSFALLSIPMFILMGGAIASSRAGADLYEAIDRWLYGVPGGLMASNIGACGIFAALSGSSPATCAAIGKMGIPEMRQRGYPASVATGSIAAGGTLGILIPPSIMLVLMADRLARPEASVGDLFLGAFFPGLMLGAMYVAYVLTLGFVSPKSVPLPEDLPKITPKVFWDVLVAVVPTAALILAVLGSIFAGLATPTEASGVGAVGATLLAAANRRLTWQVLKDSLAQTTRTTSFIFAIFLGATAFAVVLRGLGGDRVIEDALLGLPFPPEGILLTILFVVFLLGFFLDWVEITLIILPLVAPVIISLDFNLVWFTIMFAVCLQTSFLTPPVGFAIFYVKGVCPPEIDVVDIYKGVAPYILLQLTGLAIVFFFPEIVTWLPSVSFQ